MGCQSPQPVSFLIISSITHKNEELQCLSYDGVSSSHSPRQTLYHSLLPLQIPQNGLQGSRYRLWPCTSTHHLGYIPPFHSPPSSISRQSQRTVSVPAAMRALPVPLRQAASRPELHTEATTESYNTPHSL